jgi:ABC-type sulfate transport system substrate-binding protein
VFINKRLSAESTGKKGGRIIMFYGFSITKEALEKEIYPAFSAKWKAEHGKDMSFNSSFAGSEVVTNLRTAQAEFYKI